MRLRQAPPRALSAPSRLRPAAKAVDAFYRSPEWRRLASDSKAKAGFCCQDMAHEGRRGLYATGDLIADHIIERIDGGADLDEANILVRCTACHNRKTSEERAKRALRHA